MSLKFVQFSILIVIAEQLTVICDEKLGQSVYVRGLQCNVTDKFMYPNFSCFPKSYSRTVSTMNIIGTIRKPLKEILFEAKLFYKYGTIYREVFHTPRAEWCKLMKDYLQPKIPTPLEKGPTMFKPDSKDQSIYIRGLQCNASDKYLYPNFTCFPKSWSRTISTVNVIATARMPVNEIHVDAKLFYKYGTIYREVMHTPRFEWCGMAKDYLDPKMPTPLSVLVQLARDTAPEAIHPCPYTGLNVKNRTVDVNAFKSVFPSGDYKLIVYFFDGKNEPIGVINFIGEIISPLKETFGKK